jgi:hypothetical protein
VVAKSTLMHEISEKNKCARSRKDVIWPVNKKSCVMVEEVNDNDEPSQMNISTEQDGSTIYVI